VSSGTQGQLAMCAHLLVSIGAAGHRLHVAAEAMEHPLLTLSMVVVPGRIGLPRASSSVRASALPRTHLRACCLTAGPLIAQGD
jgi:hypothetical protein